MTEALALEPWAAYTRLGGAAYGPRGRVMEYQQRRENEMPINVSVGPIPHGKDKPPRYKQREIFALRKYIVRTYTGEWSEVKRVFGINTSAIDSSDAIHWLAEVIGIEIAEFDRVLQEMPENDTENNSEHAEESEAEKAEDAMSASGSADIANILRTIAGQAGIPVLIGEEIERNGRGFNLPDTSKVKVKHEKFDDLMLAIQASRALSGAFSVLLVGPAATGKTSAAAQCADILGLDFYFQGTALDSVDLSGFVDAHGKYHDTAFVKAFRQGGVMLLDEMDDWSPSALVGLNAPLSIGKMYLPNGEIINRHEDFVCLGAANTFGMGPDAKYTSRKRLDAATLSRFAAKIYWGRDFNMELALVNNKKWAAECQTISLVADELQLPVAADLRAILCGEALLAAGMGEREVRMATYLAGLTDDQRETLRNAYRVRIVQMKAEENQ